MRMCLRVFSFLFELECICIWRNGKVVCMSCVECRVPCTVCILYVQHKVKHEQLPIYVAATNVGWIEYECMYTNYTSWITLRKYFIMKGTHSRSIGRSKSLCEGDNVKKKITVMLRYIHINVSYGLLCRLWYEKCSVAIAHRLKYTDIFGI